MNTRISLEKRFEGIDAGALYDEKILKIGGFRRITKEDRKYLKEVVMKANAKNPIEFAIFLLRRIFEGYALGYICEVNNFIIFGWTSWIPFKKCFRKKGRLHVGIIDIRNPQIFWATPMMRVGDFIDRFANTLRVYKEKVMLWPHCANPMCKKMLFWEELFTYSEDQEEIANKQFPLRYLLCRNKKCSELDNKVMLITDIVLPNKKDNIFFAAPFERAAKQRARDIENGIFRISRRLRTWLSRHGMPVAKKKLPFDDLVHERQAEAFNYPDYDDLRQGDRNTYIDEPHT